MTRGLPARKGMFQLEGVVMLVALSLPALVRLALMLLARLVLR